jgi:phosphatidylcholine synthase
MNNLLRLRFSVKEHHPHEDDQLLARQLAAWLVHLYTASGGVIGMFALVAAAEGRTEAAFLLLILTMVVDATDGIMARMVRVRDVLPHFDGAMIDNVVDVLTFVWVPVFIMWAEALLPTPLWIAVPVLAALYAYGQTEMKTPDAFFLGFPSYWNIVALYLFWLRPDAVFAVLIVVIPAILTLIPTRYLYASKNDILWRTTWTLGAIWLAMVAYILTQDDPARILIWLSLFFPAYYMVASFIIDWQVRHGRLGHMLRPQ